MNQMSTNILGIIAPSINSPILDFSNFEYPITNHLSPSHYGIILFMQPNIIGVRFTKVGKIYHFDTSAVPDVGVGEHVIVDTSRGRHLGEVVQVVKETPPKPEGGWRSVERRANPRDLLLFQSWQSKQTEAMINCRARAAELHLKEIKIVSAEYNYDGSRLAFLFSTESEEKVDLK